MFHIFQQSIRDEGEEMIGSRIKTVRDKTARQNVHKCDEELIVVFRSRKHIFREAGASRAYLEPCSLLSHKNRKQLNTNKWTDM